MVNRRGSSAVFIIIGLVLAGVLFSGYYLFNKTSKASSPTKEKLVISKAIPSPEVNANVITVVGGEFFYKPNEIKVKVGQPVTIKFDNQGGFHDFVIDALNVNSGRIPAGQSKEVTFTPNTLGTFEFYCSVGQHRAKGMKGNLIVE